MDCPGLRASRSIRATTSLLRCDALHAPLRQERARRCFARHRRSDWNLDGKMRTAPDGRLKVDAVAQHARDALDDRKPEPQAACDFGALLEPLELAKDRVLLGGRNAEPGVVHTYA